MDFFNVYLPIAQQDFNGIILVAIGFAVGVLGGFFGVGGAEPGGEGGLLLRRGVAAGGITTRRGGGSTCVDAARVWARTDAQVIASVARVKVERSNGGASIGWFVSRVCDARGPRSGLGNSPRDDNGVDARGPLAVTFAP